MSKKIFPNSININTDKLLIQRDISVYINSDNYYSTHRVSKYKIDEGEFKGEEYLLFDYIDGRAIMNYQPEHYEELFKHITISDEETIFQRIICFDNPNPDIHLVPKSYRYPYER